MKTGDNVVITDGSWAVKVDQDNYSGMIGLCKDVFKVIGKQSGDFEHKSWGTDKDIVHDIFIQNTRTGEKYLHSSSYVEQYYPPACPVPVIEVTMADLERKYGCKVKIKK
jgi:hypothetical protein